jgi:alpha-mannosidase
VNAISPAVQGALARLREAADCAEKGWFPPRWKREAGPGTDAVTMAPAATPLLSGAARFDGLRLEAGTTSRLRAEVELPELLAATPLAGDVLLAGVWSVYPVSLEVDGRSVFRDALSPVACGPALVEALPAIEPGRRVQITLTVDTPANQVNADNLLLSFTTSRLWSRFLALDCAWAQLALASGLAVSDEETKAVERAAWLPPDLLALDGDDLAGSLETLATTLAPLASRIAGRRVHAIGHSHIDLQWQWTWSDTKEVIKRDVRSVLSLMDEFPQMTFTHSQPAGYELLRREEPELFAALCDRVAEGRWEPATMQWVECDVNLVSGEAQARQLLEGVTWTRRHLGVSPTVHLAPDTFGHVGNLPQLTAGAGARAYYHHRGNPGQASDGRMWPAYWWNGDDGTRLLALSSPVYLGPLTPGRVARDVLALTSDELPSCVYFYGVGDHGGGPTRRDLQTLEAIRQAPCLPTVFCSTLSAFEREVVASGASLPEHRGESPTIFEGCYTTHADAKRHNRDTENELVAAETLATVAGLDASAELSGEWRTLLFHQFHDTICGSAIKEAYAVTSGDLARVRAKAREVSERALDVLHGPVPEGELAVTNPLGFDCRDLVVVPGLAGTGDVLLAGEDGTLVPGQRGPGGLSFVASVPAFATRAYRVTEQGPPSSPIEVHEIDRRYLAVDTPCFFSLVRRDSGVVTTLFDRRAGRELVGYNIARARNYEQVRPDLGLGVLQLLDERPHGMSSWVIDEVYREESLICGAELRVAERGAVRCVLETTHRVRASRVLKRLVFYSALPRVDVELEIAWNEPGGPEVGVPNLLLSFAGRLGEAEAWYETPFSAARRPADGLVVPGLRWALVDDEKGGFAVLNDGKYGFDALGSRLRVHLIRTAYEPDAASDAGLHDRCAFSVVPYAGDWRDQQVTELAAGFNTPLLGRLRSGDRRAAQAWRPLLLGRTTAVIDALKFAHRGDGARVIRLHESAGRTAHARLAGLPEDAAVYSANVVEDVAGRLEPHGGELELVFRPFEVKTLIVDQR